MVTLCDGVDLASHTVTFYDDRVRHESLSQRVTLFMVVTDGSWEDKFR